MTTLDVTRRAFLGATAAGTAAAVAGLARAGAEPAASPNETIRVGIVGPGGRGTQLLAECVEFGRQYHARLTAVCDLWNLRRQAAADRVKDLDGTDPKVYARYEELLGDKDIDAVIIATPDHQHAAMLRMAVEAGKDVYCEKPMANVLQEANAALAAVRQSDRVVQIGTQRRSYPKYRRAAELVAGGAVGEVVKVDCIWNAYSPYRWAASPESLAAVKESDVDWKAFLMDKAYRPFDPRIYRSFRLFRDFSSGIIDQWMTHAIDAVHLLTGEQFPNTVVAHGGLYRFRDYRENPDTIEVALEYGRAERKFLVSYATNLANEAGKSTRVLGTRGTLEVEDVWRLSGDGSKSADRIDQAQDVAEAAGTLHHMANWLDCIGRRDRAGVYAPVEAGYSHSVACIMSTQSFWSGRRLAFDPQTQQIAG